VGVGVGLGLALTEGLGMIVGVAVGKGVCIGNGVGVGKGVVFGGALGVKVGVGTGVGVAVGAGVDVGVGTGLTDRPQPNRNPTRRKTAILKFRTITKHLPKRDLSYKLLHKRLCLLHRNDILGLSCPERSARSAQPSFARESNKERRH
jgi:hypothetical protein